MMMAMTTDTQVSGRLSTTILAKVMARVMSELKADGRLELMTCRSVSTSLV